MAHVTLCELVLVYISELSSHISACTEHVPVILVVFLFLQGLCILCAEIPFPFSGFLLTIQIFAQMGLYQCSRPWPLHLLFATDLLHFLCVVCIIFSITLFNVWIITIWITSLHSYLFMYLFTFTWEQGHCLSWNKDWCIVNVQQVFPAWVHFLLPHLFPFLSSFLSSHLCLSLYFSLFLLCTVLYTKGIINL